MKKIILVLAIIVSAAFQLVASENDSINVNQQDTIKHWKFGGIGSFNFSQGYQKDWAAGGENSVSTLTIFSLFANFTNDKMKWENTIDAKYGLLKSGEENDFRKNEDVIEINSKYGYSAAKNWYYSALFNLKTQAVKGYEYPNDSVAVSDFFAPANIVLALGMDFKPNENLSILFSPLTSKTIYVRDTVVVDPTKYGIDDGKNRKDEMGAYIKSHFKFDLTKDILVENKLDFFSNFLESPQNIDVNWELNIGLKINSHMNTTISTHLIYDDDIEVPVYDTDGVKISTTKSIQFKEVLSIGFSYKF